MKRPARLFILLFILSLILSTAVSASGELAADAKVELNLNCKSAILLEQTTGTVLYQKNENERLPIASVTKIMTLLLTMEAIENGSLSLSDTIPISENAASMGGSQVYLEPGEIISLDDVLKAVFVSSANDGAVALAEAVSGSVEGFVAKMNERASALGMHDTVFYNPTGLDDGETNLSSAKDVALMSNALLKYPKIYDYTTIWIDSIRNGAFGLSNTNKLIRFYPGATGLKTGSTAKAKYCVSASAERNGLKLCAVVLAGETSNDRFQAAKTLLDYGFANWAYFEPDAANLSTVKVWGGTKKEVAVHIEEQGLLLKKSDAAGIETKIQLSEEIKAPVFSRQVVGKIVCCKGEQILYEIPVYTSEEIDALCPKDVFRILLKLFFTGSQ